eukprot:535066_1
MSDQNVPQKGISMIQGLQHIIIQKLEHDNLNDENEKGLTSSDRIFIIQLVLCAIVFIGIPLFIVLLLISTGVHSAISIIVSLIVLLCCCCIGCGNTYWVTKGNTGYQQIN